MTPIILSSSVLILMVMLIRRIFRETLSRRLRYALWLLVALRLLIPVQLGHSPYSVADLTQTVLDTAPAQQLRQELQQPVAGPSRAQLYAQLLEDYRQTTQQQTVPPQVQTQLRREAQTQTVAPSPAQLLTWLWIAGALIMGTWFLFCHFRFLRLVKRDAIPFPQPTVPVPVMICPNAPTPCLVGLFRPRICLTPASTEDDRTLRHVLTHECTHLRHLDHLWAWIRCLCLCVYWFHPLVWVAAILSKRDCELACDEGSLTILGDGERIAYGRTLLDTVTQHRSPTHVFETATAMNETAKQLKERVTYIVKDQKSLWIAVICVILTAAIAVGCTFTGSKLPTADQNPQLLADLVHEAEALAENNDTLTLDPHDTLKAYIGNNAEKLQKAVTVTDTAITLDTTDPHIQTSHGDLILDEDVTMDLIYLTFLDLLTDRYGDALARADLRYDAGFDHYYDLDLLFYPQYRKEGFSSIQKLCSAVTDGTHPAPDYAFYLSLHEPSIRWATDPVQELDEQDHIPPESTTPPMTTAPTVPENTLGPDALLPSDCSHLFSSPDSWYLRGLTSHYDSPEQVDLAAFFADGMTYTGQTPTEEEWAVLKDIEGFERDDRFRRLSQSEMDEILMLVFGLTLEQTEGIGLERMVFMEQTQCWYLMASELRTPQIQIEPATLGQDYMEYTDDTGLRHYVSLTATLDGLDYDYKIVSHRTDPTDRRLNTIALAGELGYSYAEFLYLSQKQIEDHLAETGHTDPQTLRLVAMDTIAMYDRSLTKADGQYRLRFRFLSLTDDEALKHYLVRDFRPQGYEEPYLSAVSHRWLLSLEEAVDGAYTDSFYYLLTDALFSDPHAFLQALSELPEDRQQRIADTLPRDMDSEELSVYLRLLETVEQELRYSEGDTAALDALFRLQAAWTVPVAPTLPAELSDPIDRYARYKAVGLCCDYEGFYEDLSHRLTAQQQEIYCGYQYRLTCCGSKEEIHDHIRSYMAEDLIDRWPDDLLFTGDDGGLYLIVIPQGMINYYHPVLTEGPGGTARVCAGAYSEDGYHRTVAFSLEKSQGRCRIVSTETLAPATYGLLHWDGLYLVMDAQITSEDQGMCTFYGQDIKGTICRGGIQDPRIYAMEQCLDRTGLYEEAWIGNWSTEKWYAVLRAGEVTELRALITDGENAWELHLQSADPDLLPYMIHIATNDLI